MLVWLLIVGDDGNTFWKPYYLAEDGLTILDEPVFCPLPGSQYLFLSSPIFETGYFGNRGGGKTDTLLLDYAAGVGRGYGKGYRGILFRREFGDLDDVVRKVDTIFPRIWGDDFRFLKSKSEYTATWKSGEALLLRNLPNEDAYGEYHGHSYAWIGFEELTQWPNDKAYRLMFSCARPPAPGVPVRGVRTTSNPYGVGHCVDEGDVLTPMGWIDIRNLKIGDLVYTFDADGEMMVSVVEQMHSQTYDGPLIRRKGDGLYMSFTPPHELPVMQPDGRHDLQSYEALGGQADIRRSIVRWEGTSADKFISEHAKVLKGVTPNDYLILVGWWLACGQIVGKDRILKCQTAKAYARLRKVLESSNIPYLPGKREIELGRMFSVHLDKMRAVPRELLDAPPSVLRSLLDGLIGGAGIWRSSSTDAVFRTRHRALSDNVCEIGVKLGFNVLERTSRLGAAGKSVMYSVTLTPGKPCRIKTGRGEAGSINVDTVPFKGNVHCIGVPFTHAFVIRQRGCVWLSGNSWVKKRFRLPQGFGKVIRIPGQDPRVAIQSDLRENFVLLHGDPNYPNRIRNAASNPAQARAWLLGDWDVTTGGMFDDLWNPRVHVVPNINPRSFPHGWRLNRSYDHGQARPFACLWWAESNGEPLYLSDGRVIGQVPGDIVLWAEWYGTTGEQDIGVRMSARQIAIGIRERQNDWGVAHRVRPGPVDNQIYEKDSRGTMRSPADDMEDVGITWTLSDKSAGSRIRGYQMIRGRLTASAPSVDGTREYPGLFVCERNVHWLEIVPTAPRDTQNQDELPKNFEDHLIDATRYRLSSEDTIPWQRGF